MKTNIPALPSILPILYPPFIFIHRLILGLTFWWWLLACGVHQVCPAGFLGVTLAGAASHGGPFYRAPGFGEALLQGFFQVEPLCKAQGNLCVCTPRKGAKQTCFLSLKTAGGKTHSVRHGPIPRYCTAMGCHSAPCPTYIFFIQLLCFKPLRQPFCRAHSTLLKGLLGKLSQKFVSFCQNISLGCLWPFAGWKQQFNKLFVCFCGSAGLAAGDSCYESLVLARARLVLQVTLHLSTTYGDSFLVN